MRDYRIIIGLEVHVQVKTASKIFCACSTEFGAGPNSHTCPVCTGMPGVLPVLNRSVVESAIRAAIATNCRIANRSIFARKNYFYPDLPKNYQVSQYEKPIAEDGCLDIACDGAGRRIGILRIHMEEDAGKSIHDMGDGTCVDFNRTGTPLLEIVTTPSINTTAEAYEYLKVLKNILRYIGVSDCDMEKGSLRCDANISLKPAGEEGLGVKTEVKNMNSFKSVQKALDYEAARQRELLDEGETIHQETRLWDEKEGKTFSMRSKEEAHDYRYFPEPDLVPVVVEDAWREEIARTMPELPGQRCARFSADYGLSDYDAGVLTAEKAIADYYEECLGLDKAGTVPERCKAVANWVTGELLGHLNRDSKNVEDSPVTPAMLAEILGAIRKGTISGKIAKAVFDEMYRTGRGPGDIIKEKNLVQVSDEGKIARHVDEVIKENPDTVASFKGGREKVLGHLVGQVMKKTGGRANPGVVNRLLKEKLKG